MGSRFVWFVLGAVTGAGAVLLLRRAQEQEETESFEDLAEELARRFDKLEGKQAGAK